MSSTDPPPRPSCSLGSHTVASWAWWPVAKRALRGEKEALECGGGQQGGVGAPTAPFPQVGLM